VVSREPKRGLVPHPVAVFIARRRQSRGAESCTYLHVKQPVFTLPWNLKGRGTLVGSISQGCAGSRLLTGPIKWMKREKSSRVSLRERFGMIT
jgi:hypothetical protein